MAAKYLHTLIDRGQIKRLLETDATFASFLVVNGVANEMVGLLGRGAEDFTALCDAAAAAGESEAAAGSEEGAAEAEAEAAAEAADASLPDEKQAT
jgi:hypothetical protein